MHISKVKVMAHLHPIFCACLIGWRSDLRLRVVGATSSHLATVIIFVIVSDASALERS